MQSSSHASTIILFQQLYLSNYPQLKHNCSSVLTWLVLLSTPRDFQTILKLRPHQIQVIEIFTPEPAYCLNSIPRSGGQGGRQVRCLQPPRSVVLPRSSYYLTEPVKVYMSGNRILPKFRLLV